MRLIRGSAWALLAAVLMVGCADSSGSMATNGNGNGNGHSEPKGKTTVVSPGPEAYDQAQTALIEAKPGDVIEFTEGRFDLNNSLSCTVDGVTIRGAGKDKTVLNFATMGAGTGSAGIYASKVKNFVIQDLAVEDTSKDGIKTESCEHTIYRNLRVEWTKGPSPENGAYGVYPVLSKDVLIEGCFIRGASDAGVYVGQSENVIVRRNEARENVAGIEIENTVGADVYENVSTGNTGGLLIFSLPELPKKNGRHCRAFKNKIVDNNHPNFGKEGNIVATIPPGSGVLIMANKDVHLYDNEISGNKTINCSVISYLFTDRKYNDAEYNPYAEGIYIHGNTFAGGGNDPDGPVGAVFKELMDTLKITAVPDVVYDGMINEKTAVEGKTPAELGVFVVGNTDGDMVNLAKMSLEAKDFEGQLPELAPIVISGVE